jgi:hypothetical protein
MLIESQREKKQPDGPTVVAGTLKLRESTAASTD